MAWREFGLAAETEGDVLNVSVLWEVKYHVPRQQDWFNLRSWAFKTEDIIGDRNIQCWLHPLFIPQGHIQGVPELGSRGGSGALQGARQGS